MAIPRVLLKGVGDPFSVTDPRTCYISEDLEDTASNRVTVSTPACCLPAERVMGRESWDRPCSLQPHPRRQPCRACPP